MPTFKLQKNIIHYYAYKKNIGIYPTPTPIEFFKSELTEYTTSKGAIQLPLSKPLPKKLLPLSKKSSESSLYFTK